jgi:hypothetical protein
LDRNFYKPAVTSWFLWFIIPVSIYCIVKKKSLKQILTNVFYSSMLLASVIVFAVSLPIPGPRLEKPKNYIAVDIHSHTISSHDNISTVRGSLKAHELSGFDIFFNTEHNQTNGFSLFPKEILCKTVYPGMQIVARTNGGAVSVILLSSSAFNGQPYKGMRLEELVQKAHQNKMLVIMPHWWKWHLNTFEELYNIGIDGFEIYNCGYRNFDKSEQKDLIKFCKDNNLSMFGVTDWHGWGFQTDVWTVFKGDAQKNIWQQLVNKPEIKVILYRQEQSGSYIRFIFEPFSAFYYYIKNAQREYVISFGIWFICLFITFFSGLFQKIKKSAAIILAFIFANYAIYFYIIAKSVANTNVIIMRDVFPALLAFCVLWLVLWRLQKNEN